MRIMVFSFIEHKISRFSRRTFLYRDSRALSLTQSEVRALCGVWKGGRVSTQYHRLSRP